MDAAVRAGAGSSTRRAGCGADLVVRVAALPPAHVTSIKGIRVTTRARTVADLARMDSALGLAAADAALAGGVSGETLSRVLSDCASWPGVRRARWVLDHASPLPESPLESLARADCLAAGLAVEPQVTVFTPAGDFLARVDLLDRASGLVVEADGLLKYRTGADALVAEKLRQEQLERAGLVVVRLTWYDVRHRPLHTRDRLLAAQARALALPPPAVSYGAESWWRRRR